jgi:hypothetical protein
MRSIPTALLSFALALPIAITACGSTSTPVPNPNQNTPDAAVQTPPTGSCNVQLGQYPIATATHVSVGTDVSYATNPATSGPHYPFWAAFREYDKPVDKRIYVHNLEHGGVVVLYNCPQGCPDVVTALRKAIADMPADSKCQAPLRTRTILAPDPTLPTQIGVAAWGANYKATCIDQTSLGQFLAANYARGPEDFCSDGQSSF